MKPAYKGSLILVAFTLGLACATAPVRRTARPSETAVLPVEPPVKLEPGEAELFHEGVVAFQAGRYPVAVSAFQGCLRKNPDNIHSQFNLALAEEQSGESKKALAAYESAHHLRPDHSPTLLNLGRMYRADGRLNDAISLYEAALALPGKAYDVGLLNNLSVTYRLAKRFAEAEAAGRKVLSRSANNGEAYKNLALVYYDEGNYPLAELVSASARKYNPKDPGVHNNLGMTYLKMEDVPRALEEFKKAVALDPKFAAGYRNLGSLALSYRDYANAERAFEQLVSLEPENHSAHLDYAYALTAQRAQNPKKGALAGAQFEKALAQKPDDGEAVCGAGWAYSQERGSWTKATGYLKRCADAKEIDAARRAAAVNKLKSLEAMARAPPPPAAPPAPTPAAVGGAGQAGSIPANTSSAKREVVVPSKGSEQPQP